MSADGKRILVSVGQKVHVWRTPKPVPDRVLFRHPGQVLNVILSPDGKLIATTCSDGNVRLWDVASRTLAFPPMPHPEVMRWLTFSPGGKWLASTNKKGEARVWDVATGAVVGEVFPHANMGLTFSPDETLLATAGGGKEINGDANRGRVWEVATGKLVMHTTPYRFSASAVDFSADGKRLLTGSIDGAAQIWEVASGREIATLLSPPNEQTSPADGGPLQVARFSPDGSKALTADANGTMRLWDGHTGRPVGQVMRNNLSILSAVFSPDGRRIATGSMDKTARLWDVETTTEIAVMRHDTYVLVLAFRPDGRQLLTGTEGAEVRLWDGWTGAPLGMPMPTYGKPGNVAFSPDGKKMLTAGSDTAQLWDSLLEPPSHIVMDRMLQLWTGQETTRTGRSRTLTNKEWLQLFDEEPAGSD
jgi:WD40 repeat protein